jgi:3-deoxy-manno-octulosonate cytidylyltransferase (CMP-KDO synthetase)
MAAGDHAYSRPSSKDIVADQRSISVHPSIRLTWMTSTFNAPVIGVIPARLASTRLARKVLREILGKPMLAWVHGAAANAAVFDRLIVAADSAEVVELCRDSGWEVRMTAPGLASGTDRVHAIAQQLDAENALSGADAIFVNIQGDEPLLRPEHFQALLRPFARTEVDVSTLRTPCPAQDIPNPNVVKVVVDHRGTALYFSRASIPWDRDGRGGIAYWKHLGLYAYRKHILDRFPDLPASRLETAERLEQLRLLENGIPIHVEPVEFDTIGVDTEDDLTAVAALLSQRGS